jgi:hypothetical protein
MPPLSAVVIDYSSLIPVLIAAIQEQQNRFYSSYNSSQALQSSKTPSTV